MSARRKTVVAAAVTAGLAVVPGAMAIGPSDFAVNIPDGPTQMSPPSTWQPTPTCTPALPTGAITAPPSPGPYLCDLPAYAWSQSATPMSGTVTVISTGATGTISLLCDYNMEMRMKVSILLTNPTSPTTTVSDFTGTGGQACSWEIKVGASTLIGTLNGTTALSQVNAQTGRFTGNFTIVVTGGTGEYANANGVGLFTQVQDFPFPQPPPPNVPTGIPSGIPSGLPSGIPNIPGMSRTAMEAAIGGAVAHQSTGSPMQMKLRTGKPRATFIVPKGTITTATQWKVHMATAPGVSCSVVAKKGTTTKKLGTLKKVRTGQLVGTSYAPKVLGKGTWKLTPTCKKSGTTLPPRQAIAATLRVT